MVSSKKLLGAYVGAGVAFAGYMAYVDSQNGASFDVKTFITNVFVGPGAAVANVANGNTSAPAALAPVVGAVGGYMYASKLLSTLKIS